MYGGVGLLSKCLRGYGFGMCVGLGSEFMEYLVHSPITGEGGTV
jgi:hypothetical protein